MGGGINASIPLMGIQPQIADPVQQYERAMQIKSIIGQQALQQQQQRANEIGIQQAQQSQQDQAAMTQAMQAWDGSDYTQLPSLILKNGGSAQAVFAAVQHLQDMKQKASEIAKNDAITNSNNAETTAKQGDQYRGRMLAIVNAPADQQQNLYATERNKEILAGTIKPTDLPEQYPGNEQMSVWANSHALGSQLVKEADEKQKTANESWKPLNGQLVNTQTGEKIGANLNVPQLNQALAARYQVLNPGQPLPPQFTLQPNATPEDFSRIDKILEASEKAAGTKAQQETANAIRTQTLDMARDKQDLNAVVGTDPKTGRPVLVPFSQAQQMGIQNPMKADADMTNKALAARHWLTLANQQGDPNGDPSDMGIMQLIEKLDSEGKLGPLAGRWNDFMAGKFGAGDPEYAALRAKMGLSTTLLMQAHVGSRGGSALLEHFEDLANAGRMDGQTLKSAMASEGNYVQDKAMDPSATNYRKPSAASGPPAGATMKVPGSDGKLHWSDGKRDLGVVQP